MAFPENKFKRALGESDAALIGLFLGLGNSYTADLLADTGFDWLLIDAEHGPNDVLSVLPQLQALAPHPVHPVTRVVNHDPALIKQMLDIGAQTLLVPMVDSAAQARAVVQATRYPPAGVRGVGSALARAARWNGIPGYLQHADGQICLIVQCESRAGLQALDEILTIDGIDAVFIGPSDLAASMGHIGQPDHPEVRAAVLEAIAKVNASGKAAGVFAVKLEAARAFCAAGAKFVALGTDTLLLRQSASALAKAFKDGASQASGAGY